MLGIYTGEKDVEGDKNYISNLINLITPPLNINRDCIYYTWQRFPPGRPLDLKVKSGLTK